MIRAVIFTKKLGSNQELLDYRLPGQALPSGSTVRSVIMEDGSAAYAVDPTYPYNIDPFARPTLIVPQEEDRHGPCMMIPFYGKLENYCKIVAEELKEQQ